MKNQKANNTQDNDEKEGRRGNSLAVQWLGLRTSIAGGMGSIPGCGTKIPQAAWCGQKQNKTKQTKKKVGEFVLKA